MRPPFPPGPDLYYPSDPPRDPKIPLARPKHDDDFAVERFAEAMKDKLARKRGEGRGGWDDKDHCSNEFLSALLREHVEKGDPVDVANFAMMIHQRCERIAPYPFPNKRTDGCPDAWMPSDGCRKYFTESRATAEAWEKSGYVVWALYAPSLVARVEDSTQSQGGAD
jgi:hypothetical protein